MSPKLPLILNFLEFLVNNWSYRSLVFFLGYRLKWMWLAKLSSCSFENITVADLIHITKYLNFKKSFLHKSWLYIKKTIFNDLKRCKKYITSKMLTMVANETCSVRHGPQTVDIRRWNGGRTQVSYSLLYQSAVTFFSGCGAVKKVRTKEHWPSLLIYRFTVKGISRILVQKAILGFWINKIKTKTTMVYKIFQAEGVCDGATMKSFEHLILPIQRESWNIR